MKLRYAKEAVKTINSLDKPTKQRIKDAVESLPNGNVKPLRGIKGLYRLRVGDWRIIFSLPQNDTILVEKIAPRGDVYKGGMLK